jgi:cholinesterase
MTHRMGVIGIGLVLCSTVSADTGRSRWQALYTFGDSYTDSGAGYVGGNGPTAVVYLATALGIPFTYAGDSDAGGKSLNFAVSGALTGKGDGYRIRPAMADCGPKDALLGRGIQTQVLDFAQRAKAGTIRIEPETTLFFIAGGLNDYNVPTAISIANLEGEIRLICDVGGRYFLVALLPTKIPDFTGVGTRATRRTGVVAATP